MDTQNGKEFTQKELESEDVGIAAAIYIPDPEHLAVVWNYKTEHALVECAQRNAGSLPAEVEGALELYKEIFHNNKHLPEFLRIRRSRPAYYTIRQWAIPQMRKEGIRLPKRDGYGNFCGKIWGFEVRDFPATYPMVAMARELAEEGGVTSLEEDLIWNNVGDPEKTHEKWFFWVKKVQFGNSDGEWKKTGVTGEMRAPEVKPFKALHTRNFYYSHAVPVIVILAKLVEAGNAEYRDALEYMKEAFAPEERRHPAKPVGKEEILEQGTLSDSEFFLKQMEKMNVVRR